MRVTAGSNAYSNKPLTRSTEKGRSPITQRGFLEADFKPSFHVVHFLAI